jgi:putative glutamine amidotransferase
VIGICAAVERVRWGPWDEVTFMLPRTYVAAVQRAGGLALMLPPDAHAQEDPDELLDLIDGLVLAGGSDIDPATYGAERHPETSGVCRPRDDFELALARRALERDMPLLGICRGMEVMNIACGGTLYQHLPEEVGHENHRHSPGVFADHEVELDSGSLAARAAGEERHAIKSHHHQGVERLGEGLEVTGRSQDDDAIEAIERPDRRFALGVLWHPEQDETSRVIGALVEEARAKVAGRASHGGPEAPLPDQIAGLDAPRR